MVYRLKIPDDLSRRRAQRDDRIRVPVVADALAAVVVRTRTRRGNEHEIPRRVGRDHRPGVRCAGDVTERPRQLVQAGSVESRGTGSQVHFNAPVRASNARTSPLAALMRLLSATDDPVTSRPLMTAGGDVS